MLRLGRAQQPSGKEQIMNRPYFVVFVVLALTNTVVALQQTPPAPAPSFQVPPAQKAPARTAVSQPPGDKTFVGQPIPITPKEKVSYSLGLDLGRNFKQQEIEVDVKMLSRGLLDALQGSKLLMSEKDINETMEAFRQQMVTKQQARMKVLGQKNKQAGEQFLAENKTRPGVVTLPSGLQYKEITAGKGSTPKSTDTVTTHYRGTLIDGSEFDNSHTRGEPVTFEVSKVIPGWTEALQLMQVGAKWQLFVPASLAYGERSPGPEIPPNATLVFEIELLSIK
jgi:FKBP-type peptidyl-prolyl cis-trans isomerase FklB